MYHRNIPGRCQKVRQVDTHEVGGGAEDVGVFEE